MEMRQRRSWRQRKKTKRNENVIYWKKERWKENRKQEKMRKAKFKAGMKVRWKAKNEEEIIDWRRDSSRREEEFGEQEKKKSALDFFFFSWRVFPPSLSTTGKLIQVCQWTSLYHPSSKKDSENQKDAEERIFSIFGFLTSCCKAPLANRHDHATMLHRSTQNHDEIGISKERQTSRHASRRRMIFFPSFFLIFYSASLAHVLRVRRFSSPRLLCILSNITQVVSCLSSLAIRRKRTNAHRAIGRNTRFR